MFKQLNMRANDKRLSNKVSYDKVYLAILMKFYTPYLNVAVIIHGVEKKFEDYYLSFQVS